jgi:colicin import membrane protein
MNRSGHPYTTRRERMMSGSFALGMHLLFFILLVAGVSWQRRLEPSVNIVDLYASLPPEQKPAPPPPPPPVIKPEPKPVERPPVKAEPKPEPKPEITKADIALKQKAEKERRALEEKKEADKRALEEKREKEKKEREAKKRAEEAKLAAALQKQQQAEAERAAREQQELARRAAERAAAAHNKLRDEYVERIKRRIRQNVVLPPNMQGNPQADFDVVLLPGGEVLDVKLRRSSGVAAYDNAVERAIRKAQPLPLPPEPAMFAEFRNLTLTFRPQE